jgi:hypothetical protein
LARFKAAGVSTERSRILSCAAPAMGVASVKAIGLRTPGLTLLVAAIPAGSKNGENQKESPQEFRNKPIIFHSINNIERMSTDELRIYSSYLSAEIPIFLLFVGNMYLTFSKND